MRPPKYEVQRAFDTYNSSYFGGSLPTIPIHWRRTAYYGQFIDPSPARPFGLIVLSCYAHPVGPGAEHWGWRGILLHEMVHAYEYFGLDRRYVEGSTIAEDHDAVFAAVCNRVGRLLGLPDVSVEESWGWPWVHYSPDSHANDHD